jgi:hypothetical protein
MYGFIYTFLEVMWLHFLHRWVELMEGFRVWVELLLEGEIGRGLLVVL